MDAEKKQRIIDNLNTYGSEMLHVVNGQIRIRPEWRARVEAEHLADADVSWCDCHLHDPRP